MSKNKNTANHPNLPAKDKGAESADAKDTAVTSASTDSDPSSNGFHADGASESSATASARTGGGEENHTGKDTQPPAPSSSANSGPKDQDGKKTADKKAKASAKDGAKSKVRSEKPAAGFRISWLALTIVLVVLLVAGGVGYGVYYDYHLLQNIQQTNRSQTADHQALAAQVAKLRDNLSQVETLNQKLRDQLDDSAQQRQAIQQSVTALSEQLAKQGRGPRQWRLAEVDYLLNIANQRLVLQRDVATALHALADADARLKKIGDPALIPVRKDIASEMTALKAVQLPDIDGMAVTLQGLEDNIEHLPLVSKEHVFNRSSKAEPAKDWRDLPGVLWKDIKSLVVIRRNQPPVERLLPPQEIHYLYQNLGLKLEQARIALLQQNSTLFKRNLDDIRTWIKRYFDVNDTAVSSAVTTIDQLAQVDLKPALPDISASLRGLRERLAALSSTASTVTSPPQRLSGADHPLPSDTSAGL